MKIVDGYPPNFEKVAAAFPEAKRKCVMFTYGSVIYAPHGIRVPASLRRHEEIHSHRQSVIGIEKWWDRYIIDKDFRFEEELLAHRAEYNWFRTNRPEQRKRMLKLIAERLSSDLYGCVVPQADAQRMIFER